MKLRREVSLNEIKLIRTLFIMSIIFSIAWAVSSILIANGQSETSALTAQVYQMFHYYQKMGLLNMVFMVFLGLKYWDLKHKKK